MPNDASEPSPGTTGANGEVSLIAKLIGTLGYPIVISLILLGLWSGIIPSPTQAKLEGQSSILTQHISDSIQRSEDIKARLDTLIRKNEMIIQLLRISCFNNASNDASKTRCLEVG